MKEIDATILRVVGERLYTPIVYQIGISTYLVVGRATGNNSELRREVERAIQSTI